MAEFALLVSRLALLAANVEETCWFNWLCTEYFLGGFTDKHY